MDGHRNINLFTNTMNILPRIAFRHIARAIHRLKLESIKQKRDADGICKIISSRVLCFKREIVCVARNEICISSETAKKEIIHFLGFEVRHAIPDKKPTSATIKKTPRNRSAIKT